MDLKFIIVCGTYFHTKKCAGIIKNRAARFNVLVFFVRLQWKLEYFLLKFKKEAGHKSLILSNCFEQD